MTSVELIGVILTAIMMLSGCLSTAIAVYFVKINPSHLQKMDDFVVEEEKRHVLFDHWSFRFLRILDYGMLITFPSVAKRAHPNAKELSKTAPISKAIRITFIIDTASLLIAGISGIAAYIIMPD